MLNYFSFLKKINFIAVAMLISLALFKYNYAMETEEWDSEFSTETSTSALEFSLNLDEPSSVSNLAVQCYRITEVLKDQVTQGTKQTKISFNTFDELEIYDDIFGKAKNLKGKQLPVFIILLGKTKAANVWCPTLDIDAFPDLQHYKKIIEGIQNGWKQVTEENFVKKPTLFAEDTLLRYMVMPAGFSFDEMFCRQKESKRNRVPKKIVLQIKSDVFEKVQEKFGFVIVEGKRAKI